MKDIIDKRNEAEKIRKSIIKYWNVQYVPVSPSGQSEEEKQKILEELEREAAEKEEKKRKEIEALKEAAKDKDPRLYNAKTGSYSGTYGRGKVDDVTKGQIDQILRERSDVVRDLVENGGEADF